MTGTRLSDERLAEIRAAWAEYEAMTDEEKKDQRRASGRAHDFIRDLIADRDAILSDHAEAVRKARAEARRIVEQWPGTIERKPELVQTMREAE